MQILESNLDVWNSKMCELPCALYFYILDDRITNYQSGIDDMFLGNCPSIQSVQYVPFLDLTNVGIMKVPYDTERFGTIENLIPGLTVTPKVYRILGVDSKPIQLGSFKCYTPNKTVGGKRNWRNESRLYNYPYSFAMLSDNLNPPMEIKYHLCKQNENHIKVKNTISDRCSYGLFIDGYKNDLNGRLEALVSGEAHELPCSSSAYSTWFASNKNQMAQEVRNNSNMAFIQNSNLQSQMLPSLLGQVSFRPSQLLQTGSNMYNTYLQNTGQQKLNNQSVQNSIAMNMATKQDLKSTPNTMVSMGSDVYYGLENGKFELNLYRFRITEEYLEKLGDYFAMFGYKQNKVMDINIRNRNYYNYIKTVGVNISSTGIPRNDLEELKTIYNNGTTIWHVGREGCIVGDYSNDNFEVNA